MTVPGAGMSVTVDVHVHDEAEIRARVHPNEQRVVLRLTGGPGPQVEVTVFVDRPNLERLRDVLTGALTELVFLDPQTAPDTVRDMAA